MIKILAISDTHGKHPQIQLPFADIIIHAGDFCAHGNMVDCIRFFNWFGSLPHKHKVCVAGNHDVWLEKANPSEVAAIVPPNVHYLNDSGCEIMGLRFWGSPVQPTFFNWAFNRDRGDPIQQHWDLIPEGTDVLITHGPPQNILDETLDGRRAGCANLRVTVENISPKLHVFGHIHLGRGVLRTEKTTFVNAAICDENYVPANAPQLIELN